ncbi:glycoside hydrolase family 38 N-terminal domain-containing protein [Nakamurella lactea]|uniref:glycoside hydrolase family 38 N-terminal domain-containing protein n=1 Tax=Nakamurella lactea TaxID=459515 RepID=UPI000428C00F|nr:glycoside hydrolase family 38 C-terminal domain-containing protein [Nakamurella lactea]
MENSRISLVAHTHWDREWYEPFQRFRMRLVDVVDDVLIRAEADPRFHFTFDGQMAAVEDYLEVRPEQRERLAALVRTGQLAIGPWRVLLDEFLCSGENIIRNLQLGRQQALALGPMMPVGYLPDMFGHIAQMPQILRLAGFDHACVYRGVPASIDTHAFRWIAPDGSTIRTEYLAGGYGNMSDLFNDPDDLESRLQRRVEALLPWFGDDDVLAMYGTDHSGPLPTLMSQVASLDTADREGLHVTTLGDYLAGFDPAGSGLPELAGELRSHARSNILPGVISIRPALKRALAQAERMVERYAEPLAALHGGHWPDTLLAMAWLRLVDSSCHDSVTGCGVDDTAVQVGARIAEAEHLGQAIRDGVLTELAAAVPSDAALVFNPSPFDRIVQVELDLPAPDGSGPVALQTAAGDRLAVQQIAVNDRILADETVDAGELSLLFRRVHDRELFGRQIARMVIEDGSTPPLLRFEVAADPGTQPWDARAAKAEVAAAAAGRPGAWRALIVDESRRRVVADIDVPALGFAAARLVPDGVPPVTAEVAGAVRADVGGLFGPGIEVRIAADGTLTIEADGTVLTGVGRIVEDGDTGDSYNYGPPAANPSVEDPDEVQVQLLEDGPLRARVLIRRRYRWPVSSDLAGRSDETVAATIDMTVELRTGERFVRLDLDFDNVARDHRVRLHVPCARPTSASDAEGQFAVVRRSGEPETGPVGEFGIPTYPASGFVDAGGAAVLLYAPTEYELVDGRAGLPELAVTLVRGVGFLSRNVHPYRDEPAGPNLPTPLGQSLGTVTVGLAVLPHAGSWQDAGLPELGERFRLPPATRIGAASAGGALPRPRPGLQLSGDGVLLSAVVAGPDGSLDARVVALADRGATARMQLAGRPVVGATVVDLHGAEVRRLEVVDEVMTVPLRPWEIATVRLQSTR